MPGATVGDALLAYSKATEDTEGHRFAAIGSDELRRYGFQFHPEVDDTLNGETVEVFKAGPSAASQLAIAISQFAQVPFSDA